MILQKSFSEQSSLANKEHNNCASVGARKLIILPDRLTYRLGCVTCIFAVRCRSFLTLNRIDIVCLDNSNFSANEIIFKIHEKFLI